MGYSRYTGGSVRDSYTGLLWCWRGLHLLTPKNSSAPKADGRTTCLACVAINRRRQRHGRPPLPLPPRRVRYRKETTVMRSLTYDVTVRLDDGTAVEHLAADLTRALYAVALNAPGPQTASITVTPRRPPTPVLHHLTPAGELACGHYAGQGVHATHDAGRVICLRCGWRDREAL